MENLETGRLPASKLQNALLIQSTGEYGFCDAVEIPEISLGTVLVKTVAVALNPADVKMPKFRTSVGTIGGYDFSSRVILLGSQVQRLCVGDRVCGVVMGGNIFKPSVGAFCEFIQAEESLLLKIPESMRFEEAAALGVSLSTVGMALYQSLGLRFPSVIAESRPDEYFLVYGGSTSCGTMAIQLLKLSGYKVITTCSPRNFDLVKGLGAAAVFDYHSSSCGFDIRKLAKDSLGMVLDCVTNSKTMKTCYEAMGDQGGNYTALDPFPIQLHVRNDIKPRWIFCLTMFGQQIMTKSPYKRKERPQDRMFMAEWYRHAQNLLLEGILVPHPIRVFRRKGIAGIMEGIIELGQETVSGEKLVHLL